MPEVLPAGQEVEATATELNALAAAYGKCMWDWSNIEAELFLVFMAASGLARSITFADTKRRVTLARTFFAVKGIEIRLAMTHELARYQWEETTHFAIWKGIHDELDKQRRVRGRIGHRTGFLYPNPDSSKPPIALLIDPRLHVDIAVNFQEAINHGISLVKLLQIHSDFLHLQGRMHEFVLTLMLEQHAASAQPQADPPRPLRTDKDDQTPKGSP